MFEYVSSQEHRPEGATARGSAMVHRWVELLADQSDQDERFPCTEQGEGAGPEDAELIDRIRALEELKAAAAAAQARAAAAFDASQRRKQAAAGVRREDLGRGIASQIALARRESPSRGGRLLGFAKALTAEMPYTLQALSDGKISEWRATLLVRETACLDIEDRRRVDKEVAGDPGTLEKLGDRQVISRARGAAYRLDPAAAVRRAAKAESERFVSCRPAPDTMTYLTGLLPVAQGVGVYAALSREADRLRASGDSRGRGQIMADTLVERITGQADARLMNVEVQLVMSDRTLLGGESEPALVPGYGPVPAQWARDLVRGIGSGRTGRGGCGQGSDKDRNAEGDWSIGGDPTVRERSGGDPTARERSGRDKTGGDPTVRERSGRDKTGGDPTVRERSGRDKTGERWIRRLYAAPDTGELIAMDARSRLFPRSLARFVAARDQTCRMPWCGAPIRQLDHIRPHRDGGATSGANGQGLCEACNQAKEAPGWKAEAVDGPGPHTVETTTPTGHTYRSTAPALPGSKMASETGSDGGRIIERPGWTLETGITDLIWAA